MIGRIIDTETTGLKGKVVEVASLRFSKDDDIGEPIIDLVNPECPISFGAMAVHNITNEMVADKPTIDVVIDNHKLKEYEEYFIAHNAIFDLQMLGDDKFLQKDKKVLCTLKLAQRLYPKGIAVESHKLGVLYYQLGCYKHGDYKGEFHSAGYDVYCTALVLKHMLDEFDLTLEDAYRISIGDIDYSKEPCFMKKYRDTGMTWGEVCKADDSYVRWLIYNFNWNENQDKLVEYLKEVVE